MTHLDGPELPFNRIFTAQVFADESMRIWQDIPSLVPYVDGVNIKMEKAGGYRQILQAVEGAVSSGLLVWFGCMVGSRLNSTAASHLFGLACGRCDPLAPIS